MTANDKYSLFNRDNLVEPNGTQLSQKQKAFSGLFLQFSKSTLNFQHFGKNMTLTADFFAKNRTPKNVVRYMCKKSRFKGSFDRQHGKRVETLLRSGKQNRYHIY